MNRINLCIIAQSENSLFIDIANAIQEILTSWGLMTSTHINKIIPGIANIVFGATQFNLNLLHNVKQLAGEGKVYIFNLEQLGENTLVSGDEYQQFISEFPIIDLHEENINRITKRYENISFFIFPLLQLNSQRLHTKNVPNSHDVAIFGHLSQRRINIINTLQKKGIKVDFFQNLSGNTFFSRIKRSRLILNIHSFDSSSMLEVSRVMLGPALGVPVISETSVLPEALDWYQSGIIFDEYDNIINTTQSLLEDPESRLQAIQNGINFINQPLGEKRADFINFLEALK